MLVRSIVVALGAALLALAGFVACGGATDNPVADDDAGGDALPDGGDVDGGGCRLEGQACVGAAARCCDPTTGFRVDLVRNCRATTATALACSPEPRSTTKKNCGSYGEESSCIWRPLGAEDGGAVDGGAVDGGKEVYVSHVYIGAPGFMHCGGDITADINSLPTCP